MFCQDFRSLCGFPPAQERLNNLTRQIQIWEGLIGTKKAQRIQQNQEGKRQRKRNRNEGHIFFLFLFFPETRTRRYHFNMCSPTSTEITNSFTYSEPASTIKAHLTCSKQEQRVKLGKRDGRAGNHRDTTIR